MSKDKEKKKGKTQKAYSGIADHKRQKKVLVPPMMAIPQVKLQSWMNDRLPEMLWCALLISKLGRSQALEIFRKTAALLQDLPPEQRAVQPTLSGLGSLPKDLLNRFLAVICHDAATQDALRPLLLFNELPARDQWAAAIGRAAHAEDWQAIKAAVLLVLGHQSQEATDCRWVRVLFHLCSGKLHLQTREQVQEILDYPSFGMPEKVRPTIRALEGMLGEMLSGVWAWPEFFWRQCQRDTPCEPRHTMETDLSLRLSTTRAQTHRVRKSLADHERASAFTTGVDAKHDAVFGLGAYALAIMDELLWLGNSTSILGRLGLRSLLECYVTLAYLKKRDDPALWTAYRQYGSGQAKLAFLKLDESKGTLPASVNMEVLGQLANEDMWQEFVSIDLGDWAASDLRKRSEEADVKAEYDRLYPWTSAFVHSNWAAVRNSCFDLCVNPVHRLHRRLRPDTAALGDVVEDACELVDKTLVIVDSLFPGFNARVTLLPSSSSSSAATSPAPSPMDGAAPMGTIQTEFFDILDEFFRRVTGCSAGEFAPLGSFAHRVRADAQELASRALDGYTFCHHALGVFYERFGLHLFAQAKTMEGFKTVLGGSSRFGITQLNAVRKMVLYADSILLPDPVFPWIESPRTEERFRNIQLLETVFVLLHLKPLVDAGLPSPRILIVPSFERSLEERDPTTQAAISSFVARILAHFLQQPFEGIRDVQQLIHSNEAGFLQAVDKHQLFVAPGGGVGEPLTAALTRYEEEMKQWRSDRYLASMAHLPKGMLLLLGLIERIAPYYHLLENAEELGSSPLLALPAHWHYYSLISRVFAEECVAHGDLEAETLAAWAAINEPKRQWLGNIAIPGLVELRRNNENHELRTRMARNASDLHEAAVKDLNRIALSVGRDIASAFTEHDAELQTLHDRYAATYKELAGGEHLTPAGNVLATFAPVTRPPGPSVSTSQTEPSEPSRSLIGVFSTP